MSRSRDDAEADANSKTAGGECEYLNRAGRDTDTCCRSSFADSGRNTNAESATGEQADCDRRFAIRTIEQKKEAGIQPASRFKLCDGYCACAGIGLSPAIPHRATRALPLPERYCHHSPFL